MPKTVDCEKYYNSNGEVAVLVSPGFGAGWSTWNLYPEMLFDKEIVRAILALDFSKAEELAANKYPDAYLGGLEGLEVVFIPPGTLFRIKEYDGSETIVLFGEDNYYIA